MKLRLTQFHNYNLSLCKNTIRCSRFGARPKWFSFDKNFSYSELNLFFSYCSFHLFKPICQVLLAGLPICSPINHFKVMSLLETGCLLFWMLKSTFFILYFYVGTPSGVHLFDHLLCSIFQLSITHYIKQLLQVLTCLMVTFRGQLSCTAYKSH